MLTAARNWELLAARGTQVQSSSRRDCMRGIPAQSPGRPCRNLRPGWRGGTAAIEEAAAMPEADIVVTAMVGYSGLIPTVNAIMAGKTIALANKETLVVAGEVITSLLKDSNSRIIPVDSEHSAIFQCLTGENSENISKIILTASGRSFRNKTMRELESVTVDDALNHPNWDMKPKSR